MPVSDSPWWWSADLAQGATTVSPIQMAEAPTEAPDTAAARAIPDDCAVSRLSSPPRTRCNRPPTVPPPASATHRPYRTAHPPPGRCRPQIMKPEVLHHAPAQVLVAVQAHGAGAEGIGAAPAPARQAGEGLAAPW